MKIDLAIRHCLEVLQNNHLASIVLRAGKTEQEGIFTAQEVEPIARAALDILVSRLGGHKRVREYIEELIR